MKFKQDIIAHTFRNKYLKYSGGGYTSLKSSATDYLATQIASWFYEDDEGNLHSKLNFVSDQGLTAYGLGKASSAINQQTASTFQAQSSVNNVGNKMVGVNSIIANDNAVAQEQLPYECVEDVIRELSLQDIAKSPIENLQQNMDYAKIAYIYTIQTARLNKEINCLKEQITLLKDELKQIHNINTKENGSI